MVDDTLNNPAMPGEGENNTNTEGDVLGDIAKDLETQGQEAAQAGANEDGPSAVTPQPFDLNNLSADQLATLKAMLNSTPDRVVQKKGNPQVTLTKFNGQLVTEFKGAFNTLVRDEVTNITSEVMLIPVRFLGTTDFVNINYKEFVNGEKVVCEVISRRSEPGVILEGVVISKETGRPVQQEIKTLKEWFTLRIPASEASDIKEVEILASMANA